MRFERLVIEVDENTFSLDFHPTLTVISGVGRLERENLISEMVGSLGSSRPGVHAEIVADNGNRFAILRPCGDRARMVDVDAAADVSGRVADEGGGIDLLAVADLDVHAATRAVRLSGGDLAASAHRDQTLRRLSLIEPDTLWAAAERARAAEQDLAGAAAQRGPAPEDASVVTRVEERHDRFEAAQRRAESFRRISFVGGAVSALAAVPTAMFLGRPLAMVWVLVAAAVTATSLIQTQRMARARTAEEEALAEAGAQSYLGFHLQRVNGLVDGEQARRRLMKATHEHEDAMEAWVRLAGEVAPDWAHEHRDEIEAAAATASLVDHDDELAAYAETLIQRLKTCRTVGPAGESLPLLLDDALASVDAELKAPLLELLMRASHDQQIVLLTEDTDVADWARVEAMTGSVSIVEPVDVTIA